MPTFSDLVQFFPAVEHPCTTSSGQSRYQHQCAIRMSLALVGTDPTFLRSFTGNRCPHGHARSAKALARYLRDQLGPPERPAQRWNIDGQGILFYDLPGMDHIDLWTTRLCLPRYGPGHPSTMSWTTLEVADLWFWPLAP